MIKQNYHTHTTRCGHAIGSDEDYVQEALKAGLEVLGFSDHAAYPIPCPSERMNLDQVEDYICSIETLRTKYASRIKILLGMEVECYQDQWEYLTKYRKRLDYCILGQHRITIDGKSSYHLHNKDELQEYVDAIGYACEHGLCDIIAHPDVCMWDYPRIDGSVHAIAAQLADISLQYDVPLELNCGSGVRSGKQLYDDGLRYAYPVRAFFEEFATRGCKIVIGLDIHDPSLFHTDKYINDALAVTEGLDLKIVNDLDIVSAANARKERFF